MNIEEDGVLDDSNVNIVDLIYKYLKYWKWFVLSIILSSAFILYKLNFIRPQYRATSTIKIKDEKSGDNSTLSVFQDLSIMNRSNQKIDDEIEILKSKGLLSEVVKSLKLNVQLYSNKNKISEFLDDNLGFDTEFYENEKYKNIPLKINFLISDSALYKTNAQFLIFVNSENNFTYIDKKRDIYKKYEFGDKIGTHFGDIIVIPNTDLKSNNFVGTNILVKITSVKNLANSYSGKLDIEPKSDFSSILSLTVKDGVRQRASDFLNELVKKYNERAIKLKEELSKSTSDFVTNRLEIISEELSNVDLTAESLKTKYRLSDAASNTGLNMQTGQEIERQILQTETELEQINSVKEYVSSKNDNDLIPVDVGITDNNFSASVKQYNELMLEKKRLLDYSSEKNPTVAKVSEQLKILKNNISQGLDNLESSQRISLNALSEQDRLINSRLYSAPRQEREIRDIQRQQQIKESLFLLLLQKKGRNGNNTWSSRSKCCNN